MNSSYVAFPLSILNVALIAGSEIRAPWSYAHNLVAAKIQQKRLGWFLKGGGGDLPLIPGCR